MDPVSARPQDPPRIHGAGNLEADWVRSPWLQALPVVGAGAWLAGVGRLVVVSPHPDDEVLGCGGLIHTARGLGIAVQIISVTDGEACYPQSSRWTPARLRIKRRQELVDALACLDVPASCISTLAVADGRVADAEAALAAALQDRLRPGDRVLTTWRGDGHPDHEATARAVERAAAGSGASSAQFPVWAWHWLSPTPATSPLPGALRCPLPDVARIAKRRALACFCSQLDSGEAGVPPILPEIVRERFERPYEVVLA